MGPDAAAERTTRERLIAAARELFLERGYAGVTVHAVAERAGFTTGALYGQFDGKADLLAEAIADSINAQVREHLDRAIPGRRPAEAAHELLVHVATRAPEPGDMLVLHGLAAAQGEGGDVVRAQLMTIVDTVRELLDRGQREGPIDPELDPDALLHFVSAIAFGSVALKMLDLPAPDQKELEQVIGRFEAMLAPRG